MQASGRRMEDEGRGGGSEIGVRDRRRDTIALSALRTVSKSVGDVVGPPAEADFASRLSNIGSALLASCDGWDEGGSGAVILLSRQTDVWRWYTRNTVKCQDLERCVRVD